MNLNQMLRAGWVPATDPDGHDVLNEFATALGVGGMLAERSVQKMLSESYGVLWHQGAAWIPPGAFRTYQYMRKLVLDANAGGADLGALSMADAFVAASVGCNAPDFASSLDSALRLAGVSGVRTMIERGPTT